MGGLTQTVVGEKDRGDPDSDLPRAITPAEKQKIFQRRAGKKVHKHDAKRKAMLKGENTMEGEAI